MNHLVQDVHGGEPSVGTASRRVPVFSFTVNFKTALKRKNLLGKKKKSNRGHVLLLQGVAKRQCAFLNRLKEEECRDLSSVTHKLIL